MSDLGEFSAPIGDQLREARDRYRESPRWLLSDDMVELVAMTLAEAEGWDERDRERWGEVWERAKEYTYDRWARMVLEAIVAAKEEK